MRTHAVRMRLRPGAQAAYEARHDAIWPDLSKLLRDMGILDYAIWLDPETGTLFGHLTRADGHRMDGLADEPVMRRWWVHMAPLMETNADGSPVAVPLRRVFHLP